MVSLASSHWCGRFGAFHYIVSYCCFSWACYLWISGVGVALIAGAVGLAFAVAHGGALGILSPPCVGCVGCCVLKLRFFCDLDM